MTESGKQLVRALREHGLGYKAIENRTGISVGTVRHFINKEGIEVKEIQKGYCLNCSKLIIQKQNRKRKFCSRECGLMWWHRHPELLTRKALYSFTCPTCHANFTVYGQSKRKYCTHACYIKDRFGTRTPQHIEAKGDQTHEA